MAIRFKLLRFVGDEIDMRAYAGQLKQIISFTNLQSQNDSLDENELEKRWGRKAARRSRGIASRDHLGNQSRLRRYGLTWPYRKIQHVILSLH